MTKREVLANLNVRSAHCRRRSGCLASYFVETEQWRKIVSGDADIVYGPKGSGKSALYLLLRQKREELNAKGIIPTFWVPFLYRDALRLVQGPAD